MRDLHGRLVAVIDTEDVCRCSAFTWSLASNGFKLYPRACSGSDRIRLHEFIVNRPRGSRRSDGNVVDHVDGDTTNNTKANLQVVSNRENVSRAAWVTKKSAYRGVAWSKKAGKWQAQFRSGGARRWLGYFDSEASAADAYHLECALEFCASSESAK